MILVEIAFKINHDAGISRISLSATAVVFTAQGYKTALRVIANLVFRRAIGGLLDAALK